MIRAKSILLVAAVMSVAIAHGQAPDPGIRGCFERQIAAGNRGDVEGYIGTFLPGSQGVGESRDMFTKLFKTYKLKFKLESFKVLSSNANSARVRTVTLTTKISGPAFKPNRVTMLSSIVKKRGKWYFDPASQKVEGVKYLK